jgi:hypothetical protein
MDNDSMKVVIASQPGQTIDIKALNKVINDSGFVASGMNSVNINNTSTQTSNKFFEGHMVVTNQKCSTCHT